MECLVQNLLVLEKKDPGAGSKRMSRDEMIKFMDHVPTKEEIASLGLSLDNLAAVKEIL